jgi:hypothetical protein
MYSPTFDQAWYYILKTLFFSQVYISSSSWTIEPIFWQETWLPLCNHCKRQLPAVNVSRINYVVATNMCFSDSSNYEYAIWGDGGTRMNLLFCPLAAIFPMPWERYITGLFEEFICQNGAPLSCLVTIVVNGLRHDRGAPSICALIKINTCPLSLYTSQVRPYSIVTGNWLLFDPWSAQRRPASVENLANKHQTDPNF